MNRWDLGTEKSNMTNTILLIFETGITNIKVMYFKTL